jgi:hypothetical protein
VQYDFFNISHPFEVPSYEDMPDFSNVRYIEDIVIYKDEMIVVEIAATTVDGSSRLDDPKD